MVLHANTQSYVASHAATVGDPHIARKASRCQWTDPSGAGRFLLIKYIYDIPQGACARQVDDISIVWHSLET